MMKPVHTFVAATVVAAGAFMLIQADQTARASPLEVGALAAMLHQNQMGGEVLALRVARAGGARVGGVGRVGVGRVGGVGVAGGRYLGAGRYAGWAGRPGYRRPGYGLAAGAVVGGAIAAGSYYGGYGYNGYGSGYYGSDYGYNPGYYNTSYGYAQTDYASYCAQRFKSYDPSSGTYLGYDGVRHPCP